MTASNQSPDGTPWSSILTPDDGQIRCPKHVEFNDRINLAN